jgi:hypothetical protein
MIMSDKPDTSDTPDTPNTSNTPNLSDTPVTSADHVVEIDLFSGAVQDSYTSTGDAADNDSFSSADHDTNT